MGYPTGDLFIIRSFLLAGGQACQLVENDLIATCKRLKETNSNLIGRIWSAWHFNLKHSIEREVN